MDWNSRNKRGRTQSEDGQNSDSKGKQVLQVQEFAGFPGYIPIPILIEILIRVVIKTLLSCRLVCKTWADLIYTPEFVKLHLSRSPTMCLIKPFFEKNLHLIDLEYPFSPANNLVFTPKINLPDVRFGLIGSCNGLVCLGQYIRFSHSDNLRNIFVCNPVLREYITLPDVKKFNLESCAFGFNHITNQYKVVMSLNDYKTYIYTLGVGSWRIIDSISYRISNKNYNTFFNGALHWIDKGCCICCFDFLIDEFRVIPEPSEFVDLMSHRSSEMDVCVLNDYLGICEFIHYVSERVIIWVMKEYGVKESWSKDFVITQDMPYTNWITYDPITINGKGEIMMICNDDSVVLYDLKSKAFEDELMILSVGSEFRAIAYVPSLISLKDVANGKLLRC